MDEYEVVPCVHCGEMILANGTRLHDCTGNLLTFFQGGSAATNPPLSLADIHMGSLTRIPAWPRGGGTEWQKVYMNPAIETRIAAAMVGSEMGDGKIQGNITVYGIKVMTDPYMPRNQVMMVGEKADGTPDVVILEFEMDEHTE